MPRTRIGAIRGRSLRRKFLAKPTRPWSSAMLIMQAFVALILGELLTLPGIAGAILVIAGIGWFTLAGRTEN